MRFIGNKENLVGKIDEFMQECEISINSTNQSFFDAFNKTSNVAEVYAAFCKTWDKRALKPLIIHVLKAMQITHKNSLKNLFG